MQLPAWQAPRIQQTFLRPRLLQLSTGWPVAKRTVLAVQHPRLLQLSAGWRAARKTLVVALVDQWQWMQIDWRTTRSSSNYFHPKK